METARLSREYGDMLTYLRARGDYSPLFEPFLEVLELGVAPDGFARKFPRPLVALACVQAPLELFDALGYHPFRLRCGSLTARAAMDNRLPALACPAIKSCLGHFYAEGSPESRRESLVVPATCDWTAKIPELVQDGKGAVHAMDLPRVKEGERGREVWLKEVLALKEFLEKASGRRLCRRRLQESIGKYAEAWETLGKLVLARRQEKLSGIWFMVMANAFTLDDVVAWTRAASRVAEFYSRPTPIERPRIFLAGAPICFPNLKTPRLIEKSGLEAVADELCVSERIMVGAPVYDDPSERGILQALAERYRLACHCPTFIGDARRIRMILAEIREWRIGGLIHHALKGCHPYELDGFLLEREAKSAGIPFLKIETSYSNEDERNILLRLEAFKELL